MKSHFHFYADPSHGWLMVTDDDLRAVGLTVTDFGRYSYTACGRYYLEEDCDATLFILAYKATTGRKPEIVEHFDAGESLIRTFTRLPANGRPFADWCDRVKHLQSIVEAAA